MKKEKDSLFFIIKLVLWLLSGIFLLLISYFVFPVAKRTFFPYAAVLGLIFFFLGIFLVVLTIKQGIKGRLRIFLLLTGVSAVSPFVFVIFHNLFYALALLSQRIVFLRYLWESLHVVFFVVALVISPLTFLVSIILSLNWLLKKK